jgi:spore germination cell wall hydrolase CwlJ-like protein
MKKSQGTKVLKVEAPRDPLKLRDPVDIMARTIWAEARGEKISGMKAVANVIWNRASNPRWWSRPDNDVVSVCLARKQFSCWNKDDPNRPKLLAVTKRDAQFKQAWGIAKKAIAGKLPDQTCNSDHYHTDAVNPRWARGREPVKIIGRHVFHRLELSEPA